MKNNFNVHVYNKKKCETLECTVEFIPNNALHRFCPTCKISRNKICRKTAPSASLEKRRIGLLKYHYSITLNEYNDMFEKQNGCCKICFRHQSEFKKSLAVDHDHKTGKIRGLLCSHCNRGLGSFYDNVEILKNAINYLEK